MSTLRKILIKFLIRLLDRPYYEPLSPEVVKALLTRLANDEDFERFPDFLQQCADQYRTRYLYTDEVMFKGTVLAFVTLREQILAKKKLTKKTKESKMNIY